MGRYCEKLLREITCTDQLSPTHSTGIHLTNVAGSVAGSVAGILVVDHIKVTVICATDNESLSLAINILKN